MPDEIVTTPFGRFVVDERDIIESTLKAGTCWDGPGFLQVIARRYARFGEDVAILDVGANVGSFTIWCVAQGAKLVIAVEPVPSTYRRLLANLDLNRDGGIGPAGWRSGCADRVITLPYAAYDTSMELELPRVDPGNVGGAALLPRQDASAVCVRAVLLDDYRWLTTPVSFIKIDTQGCDGSALCGLEQTLRIDRPVVVFEWDETLAKPHLRTLAGTRHFLATLNYTVHEWPSHPGNYLALPH